MDERKIELEIVNKCIKSLNEFMGNAAQCDSVMIQEYKQIGQILDKIVDRKIALELDIEGIGYERV